MTPNNKWFPTSLQERAAWFDNFENQFAIIAVNLGFGAADVTAVTNDNAAFQFLANAAVGVEAYKDAVREYRIALSEGEIGDPQPIFPPNPTLAAPLPAVPAGIFERLDDLVKRIRVEPSYTSEIGALLGIIPAKPTPISPDQMQPELKVSSLPGSVVQVSFVRGKTAGIAVETRLDNEATWSDAGKFFKSPAELPIPLNVQALPRSVQIRARYVEGNNPIGLSSTIVTTATMP